MTTVKQTLCKIATIIVTLIFYWGIQIEVNTNSRWNKKTTKWWWPEFEDVREEKFTFIVGFLLQSFFVLFLYFIFNFMTWFAIVVVLTAVGTIGLFYALFIGTLECIENNNKNDEK